MNVIEHETKEQARRAAGAADKGAPERHAVNVGDARLIFLPGRPAHPLVVRVSGGGDA